MVTNSVDMTSRILIRSDYLPSNSKVTNIVQTSHNYSVEKLSECEDLLSVRRPPRAA
jgi:hypothetical protein